MRQYMLNALCLLFMLGSNIILPKEITIKAPNVGTKYTPRQLECTNKEEHIISYSVDSIKIYKNNLSNLIATIDKDNKNNPQKIQLKTKKDTIKILIQYSYYTGSNKSSFQSNFMLTEDIYTPHNDNKKLANKSPWYINITFDEIWSQECLIKIFPITDTETYEGKYWADGKSYKTQRQAKKACNADGNYWVNKTGKCYSNKKIACTNAEKYWANGECYKTQKDACKALNGTWTDNSCQNIKEDQCTKNLRGYWADKVCYKGPKEACKALNGTWADNSCQNITKKQCIDKFRGYWSDGKCYKTRKEVCQALKGAWKDDSCQNITEGQCANNLKGYWADGKCYSSPAQACKVLGGNLIKTWYSGRKLGGEPTWYGICKGITKEQCAKILNGTEEEKQQCIRYPQTICKTFLGGEWQENSQDMDGICKGITKEQCISKCGGTWDGKSCKISLSSSTQYN